jgi:hypothetical protein
MNQKRDTRRKRVRNAIISTIVGGAIVCFLLSKIDLLDIPRAIGKVPLPSLGIAFLMYATAVFFRAVRFKMILRTGISLRQLFPIVSLYAFFANILPMRTGELSYVYLLKKQTRTPGTKGFASLIVGGIIDLVLILIATCIVGWYLRDILAERLSYFASALEHKVGTLMQMARDNLPLLIAATVILAGGIIAGCWMLHVRQECLTYRKRKKESSIGRLASSIKEKILEVGRELADTPFDIRLLGIIACSISIIALRFGTQWYLVRSIVAISIWEFSFALILGVFFSLVPVHGPAGFGTVEAPWVLALSSIANVRLDHAITSGFVLHIIIIIYCIALGLWGALDLRFSTRIADRKPEIGNV